MVPEEAIEEPRDFDVFISYQRAQKSHAAVALYWAVVATGISCFYDDMSIPVGVEFPHAIEDALKSCRVMIIVIEESFWALNEDKSRRQIDDKTNWYVNEMMQGLDRVGKQSDVNCSESTDTPSMMVEAPLTIVPITIGDVEPPKEAQLPEHLKGLAGKNFIEQLKVDKPKDTLMILNQICDILGKTSPWIGQGVANQKNASVGDNTIPSEDESQHSAEGTHPQKAYPEPSFHFSADGVIGLLETEHGLEPLRCIGKVFTCGSLERPRLMRELHFEPNSTALSSDGELCVVSDGHQVMAIDIGPARIDIYEPVRFPDNDGAINGGTVKDILCCWRAGDSVHFIVSTDTGTVQWRHNSQRQTLEQGQQYDNRGVISLSKLAAGPDAFVTINGDRNLIPPPHWDLRETGIPLQGWLTLDSTVIGGAGPNNRGDLIAGIRNDDKDYFLVTGVCKQEGLQEFSVSNITSGTGVYVVRQMPLGVEGKVFVRANDQLNGWNLADLVAEPCPNES